MVLMALPLDVALLSVTVCLLGAINAMEEAFVNFKREILSVRAQLSTKAPICCGDFPPQVIGRSILTTSER